MSHYTPIIIALACDSLHTARQRQAASLAQELKLPLVSLATAQNYSYLLVLTDLRLELRCPDANWQAIAVDFLSPTASYRQLKGGGKNQLIAKAVGIKKQYLPSILDTTAGLGADGFTLATLGCTVTLLERSPIISALLQDGLQRLFAEIQTISISLIIANATEYLSLLPEESFPDVVYLDPMFPEQSKSALAKKEMRFLRAIVGDDADAELVLTQALRCAKKRVVVKRHRLAPQLGQQTADLVFTGQSSRFDVYFTRVK